MKRVVPPGSQQEADIMASMLYGLIGGVFFSHEDIIRDQFNYEGVDLVPGTAHQKTNGQPFTGLKIKMATGTYSVKIERES